MVVVTIRQQAMVELVAGQLLEMERVLARELAVLNHQVLGTLLVGS